MPANVNGEAAVVARADPKPLRIGLIGGSNSVRRPGYFSAFLDILQRKHGVEVGAVTDIAIGASTSFIGLIELLSSNLHEKVDLLLFEYTLNDDAAIGVVPERLDQWGRCYEGILRKCLGENPDLIFCTVVLGARRGRWRHGKDLVAAGSRFIAGRYAAPVIDINHWLLTEHAGALDEGFYDDDYHFARPESTDLVGKFVAAKVAKLLKAERPTAKPLPPPLYKDDLSTARYLVDIGKLSVTGPLQRQRYRNSRYDRQATMLDSGTELRFTLSGIIVALNFISEPWSGILEIRTASSVVQFPTRRTTFNVRAHKWLFGLIQPEIHFGVRLSSAGDEPVSIRLLPPDDRAYDPESGVSTDAGRGFEVPKDTDQAPQLALLGILYKGHLAPVR